MVSESVSHFSILWRRLIHKPFMSVYKLALKHKVKLLRNDFEPNGKPTIYSATHVFYDDIASVLCCLKQTAYILFGVENDNLPRLVDYLAMTLKGAIIVNRADKQDRAKSLHKMVDLLRKGEDVLVFPEGAWNMTPNLLVQNISWGILEAAELANANIVPVAVDFTGKDYCVIIGENFNYSACASKHEAIYDLRDAMATLTWELLTTKQPATRENLNDTYWLEHIQREFARVPKRKPSSEERYIYRPKGEVSLGEVLADMQGIEYKSMAADYEQHKRIMRLCDNWNRLRKYAPT